MDIREYLDQMLEGNLEALKKMPLPPGLDQYVAELVQFGRTEQVLGLLKLAFIFGIQHGAGREAELESPPVSIKA